MNHRTAVLLTTLLLLPTIGGCSTLSTPTFADDAGAIRGYDPVAYHLDGAPTKGHQDFSSEYNGATWYFSSSENQRLFQGNPEKYAPQYGGYCAYAMSKGYIVSIDPNAWHIDDGKLYLNYSQGVRRTWLKDFPKYVDKADQNWSTKLQQSVFE